MERDKVRVNLGNYVELMKLPGIGRPQADAIIKWRAEHGPIADEAELRRVLAGWPLPEGIGELIDFSPAEPTAPEAPGA
ncbi:MAG TPA: helix-hairpin-helix domain-containing protein [Thermodesulfobacteriota bacterium]|nr:helix-hairpin-helix domain-containing protein [Thermodesulfobacteriota bacterium]